jgi:hypothetical protein
MDDWIISVFCGILGGLIGASLHYFALNWRVSNVESRVLSVQNAIACNKGNANRQEQEGRMQEALVFAMSKMQAGGADGAKPDLQGIIKETAARYPDVAMKLMKGMKL